RRLRRRSPCSALGRSDRGNVSLPFMDLFFAARDLLANRSGSGSEAPLDGRGCSDGHQTIAHYDRAHLRWDINRSLWNHRRRAHRPSYFDLFLRGHAYFGEAVARRDKTENTKGRDDCTEIGALESLAKLARIQFADAPIAIERYPGPLLRADSLRVGGHLRDGLHRGERRTGWRAYRHRDGGCDSLHYSRIALCGPLSTRAVRDRDLHHVYTFPDQLTDVAKFFDTDHRVYNSRPQRIRRYVA